MAWYMSSNCNVIHATIINIDHRGVNENQRLLENDIQKGCSVILERNENTISCRCMLRFGECHYGNQSPVTTAKNSICAGGSEIYHKP